MLFLQLFYTFLLIGAFTFGGGYSMIALIQNEVVVHHGWLSAAEFTDLLAVSQMTPGPVGINTATYAGYTAVLNAGYPQWAAVGGSLMASMAVIIIPVALMFLVGSWLLRHKDHPHVATIMRVLRLAVVGLIAAAALQLLPSALAPTSVGTVSIFNFQFSVINLLIFAAVFLLAYFRKVSPIALIVASGVVGLMVYSF
jgi:chromate transporter